MRENALINYSGSVIPLRLWHSVTTTPGLTELTLTPSDATSRAQVLKNNEFSVQIFNLGLKKWADNKFPKFLIS